MLVGPMDSVTCHMHRRIRVALTRHHEICLMEVINRTMIGRWQLARRRNIKQASAQPLVNPESSIRIRPISSLDLFRDELIPDSAEEQLVRTTYDFGIRKRLVKIMEGLSHATEPEPGGVLFNDRTMPSRYQSCWLAGPLAVRASTGRGGAIIRETQHCGVK
jgi:hypothetical protein